MSLLTTPPHILQSFIPSIPRPLCPPSVAVTRPGRFDLLLFVGTPNLQARKQRLEGKLSASLSRTSPVIIPTAVGSSSDGSGSSGSSSGGDIQAAAVAVAMTYFTQHWDTVRFLTFAENEAVLSFIVDR